MAFLKNESFKALLYTVIGVIGSMFSPLMGAPFLMMASAPVGLAGFALSIFGVALITWGLGNALLALNLVGTCVFVILLTIFIRKKIPLFWSGIVASTAGVLTYGLFFAGWCTSVGNQWLPTALLRFVETLNLVGIVGSGNINTSSHQETMQSFYEMSDVFYQIPSAVFVMFGLSCAVCALLVPRLASSSPFIQSKKTKLSQFRLPDSLVWCVALALLGSFLDGVPYPVKMVAMNSLNVLICLYFFQGLGVFNHWLFSLKIDGLLRVFLLGVFCLQFFLFLSALGLIDVWLEFRKKKQSKRSNV